MLPHSLKVGWHSYLRSFFFKHFPVDEEGTGGKGQGAGEIKGEKALDFGGTGILPQDCSKLISLIIEKEVKLQRFGIPLF